MGLLSPHLDDAALADLWSDRLTSAHPDGRGRRGDAHLQTCAECRQRFAAFSNWLEALRTDAVAEADEVLSAERLATQRAQIARRLEALEHPTPARVLSFPRFAGPTARAADGPRRWIAGAAAAGLLIGVGLGRLITVDAPSGRQIATISAPQQQMARGAAADRDSMVLVPALSQAGDEAYLDEFEVVTSQVRVPESLQYLNAITPGARD